ncbi:MAG TPA: 3-keto-5-aminohexanoate cleavage protein [Erysipelotrichaceae bacterium]|nr:3-keto-5-aminohexanoate cleavage protein [Erysipelotrichaceae bacterium]
MFQLSNKIIINFTPTGMLPMKKDTPFVPVSVNEIVEDVRKAVNLGITMVHLHARDELGNPTHKKEIYAQIIRGIREFAPELIICVSTSGRIMNTLTSRSEVLDLDGLEKPDMASLTMSSLNFNHSASINEPKMILDLANIMKDKGILPEIEVFDLGMINYIHYLIKKDIIKSPFYVNFILGNIASAQTDLLHIGSMIKDLPNDTILSIGGVGQQQLKANSLAISMDYGVRVGIEDNFWFDDNRVVLASNYELLKRIHLIVNAMGKSVMSSNRLRQLLKLNSGNGNYGISE